MSQSHSDVTGSIFSEQCSQSCSERFSEEGTSPRSAQSYSSSSPCSERGSCVGSSNRGDSPDFSRERSPFCERLRASEGCSSDISSLQNLPGRSRSERSSSSGSPVHVGNLEQLTFQPPLRIFKGCSNGALAPETWPRASRPPSVSSPSATSSSCALASPLPPSDLPAKYTEADGFEESEETRAPSESDDRERTDSVASESTDED